VRTSLLDRNLLCKNPAKMIEQQQVCMEQHLSATSSRRAGAGQRQAGKPLKLTAPRRRFANPLWKSHPYFQFVKTTYQINRKALGQAVEKRRPILAVHEEATPELFSRRSLIDEPTIFWPQPRDALETRRRHKKRKA